MTHEAAVIIGGGQAGAWVARTLRSEGFTGRVVLIGDEAHWPYERPPLSKTFLLGSSDIDTMTLLNAEQAAALDVECWRGYRVGWIDRNAKIVSCENGAAIKYGTLFITTGGRVRTLPWLEGDASGRIHTLRTQDDAARLRSRLQPGGTLLVVGGGWIGLEVAATARAMNVAVTVTEAGPRLCARTMPPVVSDYLHAMHCAHGVTFRMDATLTGLRTSAGGIVASFAGGDEVRADDTVIGIGITPNTQLAEACGLTVGNGIVVDRQGRTSDPSIFAAGDVAQHCDLIDGVPLRFETWANAQHAAIVAAKASLGHDVGYAEVPWFWSDQYNDNLQAVGRPATAIRTVARGTPASGTGCWLMFGSGDSFAGAVAVNAPRELRTVRKLMARGSYPMPQDWADTSVALSAIRDLTSVPI